jgi:hypothetical protein
VEFYIDNVLKATVATGLYVWTWEEKTPLKFRHPIKIIGDDGAGNSAEAAVKVWKFL